MGGVIRRRLLVCVRCRPRVDCRGLKHFVRCMLGPLAVGQGPQPGLGWCGQKHTVRVGWRHVKGAAGPKLEQSRTG